MYSEEDKMAKIIQYTLVKIVSKLRREKHKESIIQFFKNQGITIGEGANICCNIVTSEAHLIEIGRGTTISVNVEFITHDNSISKVIPDTTDLFGKITIGNNCFIGESSIIMYGVTLADNIIVAAGSVVTRSFDESNIIIGGNPARKISTWDNFARKNEPYAWNLGKITRDEEIRLQNEDVKLVKREPKKVMEK